MKLKRVSNNPILTNDDVPFPVNSIFNPGAVKYQDQYYLLCRVELPIGRSELVLAKSNDGINFQVDNVPCLTLSDHKEFYSYVEWGIEDPRIISINGIFNVLYTGYSSRFPLVMLAQTEDFTNFKIIGPITEPSNKNAVFFPDKIGGYYWKLDRPVAEQDRSIWISRSPDLIHWGNFRLLISPNPGTWESDKIGCGPPPVKTNKGWLVLYHGVRIFSGAGIYKLGVILLDLEEPWSVIGRTEHPVLSPEEDYERMGDVPNVVFSNGWIVEADGNIKIYYGGADTCICLATTSINELLSLF